MNTQEEITQIGDVEAHEILLSWGNFRLPRKGKEIVFVPPLASGQKIQSIGKNEHGFYIKEFNLGGK